MSVARELRREQSPKRLQNGAAKRGSMRINGDDSRCGFLAAPGTRTDYLSAFGSRMKEHSLVLPPGLSLRNLVRWGWIAPVMRVALPQNALESWDNFPTLAMRGVERCPKDSEWALNLWSNAVTSPPPPAHDDPTWWRYFLNDPACELTKSARAASIDTSDPNLEPSSFRHPKTGRQVEPWIDFFAYWQIYEVAELVGAASFRSLASPEGGKPVEISSIVVF